MFFLFTRKLYFKWKKFLCIFTAWVRIEATCIETTGSGRTLLIMQCRLLHRHHTTPVVTMYRFCHTAKKSTEWAQNWNPTKLYLLNASADYRKYTPRRMRSWNSWRVMYRLLWRKYKRKAGKNTDNCDIKKLFFSWKHTTSVVWGPILPLVQYLFCFLFDMLITSKSVISVAGCFVKNNSPQQLCHNWQSTNGRSTISVLSLLTNNFHHLSAEGWLTVGKLLVDCECLWSLGKFFSHKLDTTRIFPTPPILSSYPSTIS